jgi:hypothetical protein
MNARGAVGAIALNELRHRWRSLVALGVFAGLVGGVVLGVLVLARRTQTAYDRLERATLSGDARVTTVDRDGPRAIRSLSVARDITVASAGIGRLAGDRVQYATVLSVPSPRPLFGRSCSKGGPRARTPPPKR